MLTFTRRFAAAALAAGTLVCGASVAHGQGVYRGAAAPGLTRLSGPALRAAMPSYTRPVLPRTVPLGHWTNAQACYLHRVNSPYGHDLGLVAPSPYTRTMTSVAPPSSYLPPAAGYSSYGPVYDPAAAYLHGGADVIRSQGQYLIDVQSAGVIREERRRHRIENAYRLVDLHRHIEANTPTLQDRREQSQLLEVRRALTSPPVTEILSGSSLNVLLAEAQARHRQGLRGSAVPVADGVLRHVNLTTGRGGHLGLLRGDALHWPAALREPAGAALRRRVEELLRDAARQARSHRRVDAGTLRELADSAGQLRAGVAPRLPKLEFAAYREVKTLLEQFDDAVKALGQADAGALLCHQDALRGLNAGELVRYLTEHGLKFGPATDEGRPAYQAMHEALAAYVAPFTQIAQR